MPSAFFIPDEDHSVLYLISKLLDCLCGEQIYQLRFYHFVLCMHGTWPGFGT